MTGSLQRFRSDPGPADQSEAGLGSDALSAVLCVGGMSRTPGIIQAVQSVLGPPSTLPLGHVGTVAVGSAMRAAVIDGSADGVPLVDARDRRRATIPPIPALDPLPAVSPGSTSADAEEEAAPEAADPFSDVYQSTAAMFESAMAAQQSPTNEHEQATAHPTAHPTPVVPFSNDPRVERVAAMCRHLLSLAEIPPKSLGVLEKALMPIEHDGFVGVAVGHIERAASRQLQSILVAYVERFADGHEHQLGRLLPCMGARDALRIIQMLATLRTAAGKRAIEQALASPLSVVRMQALSHLASTGEMAWEAVEPLLSDPDDDIRLQVIELIMERAYPRAGMALAARIRSDAYDKLSPSERFALLEALAAVHRKWARATAMDVLESARVFGSSAHAESRAIAADFLSRFDDPEVLGALERHASRRFTNRSAVRDSAARGADRIRRRSSRPPPR
ncbi:MAG: Hsp70 family protein [Myxococcota bacterium]